MARFPTKAQILEFIQESPDKVGKREIARAFGIKGNDKIALKRLLKELGEEGLIERGHKRTFHDPKSLPAVAVIDIYDQDMDGELLGWPSGWKSEIAPPQIFIAPGDGSGRRGIPALGIGDRILARLKKQKDGHYDAKVVKRLGSGPQTLLGIYRDGSHKGEGRVKPVDRKARRDIIVERRYARNAQSGDLVSVEVENKKRHGLKHGRIKEILGRVDDQRSVSLIALHTHGIPMGFTAEEEQDAKKARKPALGKRTDLRDLPLITIDPVDAKDFDDAVLAQYDQDPNNKGGFIVHVAIADVAEYVRPGSALDVGARERGNSVYLPDRVVPMLPEGLSNNLCSLRPNEDRACMAVRMVFDKNGNKLRHKFVRGLMRSHARLTYQQAQLAFDGQFDDTTKPLTDNVIKPLWNAYQALAKAREQREPLDFDLPEHKIELNEEGEVIGVSLRERLDAHRLIEEFMIQANVCAAETLESSDCPLIYRVHEAPAMDKVVALKDFLRSFDIKFTPNQIRPEHFNGILKQVDGKEYEEMVNVVVLRSQSQAVYTTNNQGHFGLNLRRYAHFTSPIRRYADLVVHRALIKAGKLGVGGLTDPEIDEMEKTAELISQCERRAMLAERESKDRFIASFLADRVGARFQGRISGVTRFGLFIRLTETGADGLVPMRSLDDDFYFHDEEQHALIGERRGGIYRLGQSVEVNLVEAAPITGGLRFDMVTPPEKGAAKKTRRPRKPAPKQKQRRRRR